MMEHGDWVAQKGGSFVGCMRTSAAKRQASEMMAASKGRNEMTAHPQLACLTPRGRKCQVVYVRNNTMRPRCLSCGVVGVERVHVVDALWYRGGCEAGRGGAGCSRNTQAYHCGARPLWGSCMAITVLGRVLLLAEQRWTRNNQNKRITRLRQTNARFIRICNSYIQ
jgi:hypothetical protein